MLYVKVNATSANVCVGFDVLGIALDMANVFTFDVKPEFSFTGFDTVYCCKERNLVYQSYAFVFKKLNKEPIPVEIGFQGEIPVCRGLGSSSSLIVAGVFGANAILGNPLTKAEAFNVCCELEGHPDNVAPAVYGGLIASYKVEDIYRTISYPVNSDLVFIVAIPPYPVSTKKAREVLPTQLDYPEIVHNLGRIIHIPKAFAEGNVNVLCELFEDKVHEPYRKKLIREYEEVKKICKENHVALAISGSGSTLLMIAEEDSIIKRIKHLDLDIRVLKVGCGVQVWEE